LQIGIFLVPLQSKNLREWAALGKIQASLILLSLAPSLHFEKHAMKSVAETIINNYFYLFL